VGIAYAVQDPNTRYEIFLLLALLCGFGGGNFASSMSNINFFFPKRRKGFALGLNAAGGNIGVSIVQLVVPIAISVSLFGALGGSSQNIAKDGVVSSVWIQNAAWIWLPFIILALFTTWFFMNNLHVARSSLMEQMKMFRDKHTWLMSLLYMGAFGSFIGYSAGFPLLIKSQFTEINPLQYAFLGPLIGSLIRPLGGWIADKVGGARVTFWNFAVMILSVAGVLFFLSIKSEEYAFAGFFTMFMILFFTAGILNGSTYRMIPIIYMTKNNAKGGNATRGEIEAMNRANKQSSAVVGITSSIGAYGAFFIPKSYGTSIALVGTPVLAFSAFIAFYLICMTVTYYYYFRKKAEIPC
jgi:NNP family nitrate/nitrite transporter-like MFS transporter